MTQPRRRPKQYIEDLLLFSRRIQSYVAGKTLEEFLASTLIQDAVVRNIEVLGEASRQLVEVCPTIEQRLPTLPLRAMYVTRNRLIHGYASLRLQTIWEVATREIPGVVSEVEAILSAWPDDLA